MVHITFWPSLIESIFFVEPQMASLKVDETSTTIFQKYSDFADVFSLEFLAVFLEHMGIKNRTIDLLNDKQQSYGIIHSLELVELEILKLYIKSNLANNFVTSFKCLLSIPISFV